MSHTFDRLATCDFIAEHAAELVKLAKGADLEVVAHIAEMLRMAAEEERSAMQPKEKPVVNGRREQPGELAAFAS